MMSKTMGDIITAQKKAARAKGLAWWFGPAEARFFSSRIESEAFHNPGAHETKHYFVTSEQCEFSDGSSSPRKYSVRIWDESRPERIETWGKFQQFQTKEAAVRVATRLGIYGKLPVSQVEDE
jgi:hypothetical protein